MHSSGSSRSSIIILVPISIFHQSHKKHQNYFIYFSPLEGNFDWRRGWGWRVTKSQKRNRMKIVHTFGHLQKTQKIFKMSSYIQKMTPNPINALKITSYNTKHTNNTKIPFQHSIFQNTYLLYINFP